MAAVVALVDFWLGARWFRGRSDRGCDSAPPDRVGAVGSRRPIVPAFPGPRAVGDPRPARLAALETVRLVAGRRRRVACSLGDTWHSVVDPHAKGRIVGLRPIPKAGSRRVCGDHGTGEHSAAGALAFLPDQWGRSYRFLADRGVPPKYVWLSRQLTTVLAPILLVAVILVVAILLGAVLMPMFFPGNPWEWQRVARRFSCWVTSSSAFSDMSSFASRWGSSAGCSSAAACWRRCSACSWPASWRPGGDSCCSGA